MDAIQRIIFEEAVDAGVSVSEILGTDTTRDISAPRHRAMYRARIELGASYPEIGRAFKRDHETVHEAVRKQIARMSPQTPGAPLFDKKKGSNDEARNHPGACWRL